MNAPRKLLIVGPSWVGDMVMAQSLYKALQRDRAAASIDVLAPAWSLPVLARMPEVRRGIEMPVGHGQLGLGARRSLGMRLRAEGYEQAIVLPRSWKAALVPFFARVPVRTGFRGEWRYGLINDRRPFDAARLNRTVLRFLALGASGPEAPLPELLEPSLTSERGNFATFAARHRLDVDRPAVVLMPGAEYGPAKRWPAERFAELAAGLAGAGFAVWILGSRKERALAREIAAHSGDRAEVRNLAGVTSLADAVDLLAAAAAAVSNDSGLMHVAAAVGTHVVAIYGSSSPDFTPPLTAAKTIYYEHLACSPCFERTCPLRHLRCLRDITAASVLEGVLRAVDAARGARLAAERAGRGGA